VQRVEVGSGSLSFSDGGNGTFAYTVNGFSQSKPITRLVFGPTPTCTFGGQSNLALATNYQGNWWSSAANESGWGIYFAHQGENIFAGWFTYDADGTPIWLSATATKTANGVYSGALYRTNGPAYNSVPFDPQRVSRTAGGGDDALVRERQQCAVRLHGHRRWHLGVAIEAADASRLPDPGHRLPVR
jgi:hypothetical protein